MIEFVYCYFRRRGRKAEYEGWGDGYLSVILKKKKSCEIKPLDSPTLVGAFPITYLIYLRDRD
jgi:hypothetical protein